jgi:hypothetical protein
VVVAPEVFAVPGTQLVLQATGTDPDGDEVAYAWQQTEGPEVVLTDADTAIVSFLAPTKAQPLALEVTVSDGFAETSGSVTVNLGAQSGVSAGQDQQVESGSLVRLQAVVDDPGDPPAYAWVQTAGPDVVIQGMNQPLASFLAPAPTGQRMNLAFEVTATRGETSMSDTVIIIVNNPPTVVVERTRFATKGTTFTLQVDAQDPDGDELAYAWVQTFGRAVDLQDGNTAAASFEAPTDVADGTRLIFEVSASDGSRITTGLTTVFVYESPPTF